jgi:hypothetical protein
LPATISRRLNVILPPVETKDGLMYIHSVPVGRAVFDACYRPMARAMSTLISDGIGPITGPSVAMLQLLSEADLMGEGEKVRNLLMSEIKRLTNCALVGGEIKPGSDRQVPYVVACQQGLLDEDQQSEVENILVYFTLASWVRIPDGLSSGMGLEGLRQLWRVQTSSSTLTEYMLSLPTSTPEENTGEKPPTIPQVYPLSTAA